MGNLGKLGCLGLVVLSLMTSCEETFQPLPMGQLRIELPEHEYAELETTCPYTLEAPDYSQIQKIEAPKDNCWSNLILPPLRAKVYLTYRSLQGDLARTINESQDLTYEHASRADNIIDKTISYPDQNVHGTIFSIEGNAASNIQFYVTDSSNHFLRGALYFNTAPNKDSLAPVIAHIREDIDYMISTIKWID